MEQSKSRLIEEKDKVSASPEKRAELVWKILQQSTTITDWDVVCFCVNFLGLMSAKWMWLEENAKAISRLVYTAHYLIGESGESTIHPKQGAQETGVGSDLKSGKFE